MEKRIFTFVIGFIYSSFLIGQSGLKISEVMYNPDTLEYYCEFVELYNCSSESLPLNKIRLEVNGVPDSLECVNGKDILAPGAYAVILDRGYLEKNLHIYPLDIGAIPLFITADQAFGKSGLSNSNICKIVLISNGIRVDSMQYVPDNPEGYSDEKRILCTAGFDYQNWQPSLVFRGTPGRGNSVLPQAMDIALDSVAWSPPDTLLLFLQNRGLSPFYSVVDFEMDFMGPDSTFFYSFTDQFSVNLDTDKKIRIPLPLKDYPCGTVATRIRLQTHDENPANDEIFTWLSFPVFQGSLIINECMIQSDETGEWMELWNTGEKVVSTKNLLLMDGKDTTLLPYAVIAPGEFLILCEKSYGDAYFQSAGVHSVYVKKWLTLNNDGDRLKLQAGGNFIDSMRYNLKERGLDLKKGISLERVDAHWDGYDVWNWGWSTDPAGHSAGRRNSLAFSEKSTDQMVDFSPNPFSPDNDGWEDVCFFQFSFPFSIMNLDICIYSLDGYLQKEFHLRDIPGNYVLVYDGSAKKGAKLYIGAYIVQIVATDIRTGRQKKVKKVLVSAGK